MNHTDTDYTKGHQKHAELLAEIAELKANNANLIEKNRDLRHRPDLKRDRLEKQIAELKEKLSDAENNSEVMEHTVKRIQTDAIEKMLESLPELAHGSHNQFKEYAEQLRKSKQ